MHSGNRHSTFRRVPSCVLVRRSKTNIIRFPLREADAHWARGRPQIALVPKYASYARHIKKYGGAAGNRTPDLVIANDALSQLSYSPLFETRKAWRTGARLGHVSECGTISA